MAFTSVNFAHLAKFNSAVSSDFINMYEGILDEHILSENSQPKHKTFAPSSFRCPRISWFRLRGVQPDKVSKPDHVMDFAAQVGTACHATIQERLKNHLKEDWIHVEAYLNSIQPNYSYDLKESGYETLISIDHPPVRFACDGIIRWHDKLYLLEIKTSEFSSFDKLTDPKPEHIDQIKCYATLLNISDVLVLYVDRQYGGLKCYELHISDADKQEVTERFQYVLDMVEANLAPDKLPSGDSWCNSNHCPYYKKCREW